MKTREEIINELKPHCPTADEVVYSGGPEQQVMYLEDVVDLIEKYEARIGNGTFRQECAKAAMQGLLSSLNSLEQPIEFWKGKGIAKTSVIFADALIKELMDTK